LRYYFPQITLIFANNNSFMKNFILLFCIYITCPAAFSQSISRIAFGSCADQNKSIPILHDVVKAKPELFIFLGDNIYGDTEDMKLLKKKYDKLGAKPEFKKLKEVCPVIATWDDHDYGINDGGADYPMKKQSKEIFLNFWGEPKDSERRNHKGIYTSYYFGEGEQRVQVILLDSRTFKTPWKTGKHNGIEGYVPDSSRTATMLGEKQWEWLEKELQQPATLRIIGMSTQFVPQYNGYELWAYMPLEKQRLQQYISGKKINGVFFISGDTHYAELSKMPNEGSYPLYELTSSGLTKTWKFIAPNQYRVGTGVRENNFGIIDIDWKAQTITLSIQDIKGATRIKQEINFKELNSSEK
jgi:alkaline phosphatase D